MAMIMFERMVPAAVHGVGGGKTLADAGADGADGDGERGGDRNDSG